MSDFSFEIAGLNELMSRLAQAPVIIEQEMKKAIDATAIFAERSARALAPHQTGTLQRSIHASPAVVTSNNVTAKVGTNIKYARAQEYGTVGMTINSHSRNGTAFSYRGNIKPKFYMKQGKEQAMPMRDINLKTAGYNIVKRLGGK